MSMRIGYGFDSHAFKQGVPLVIGGLPIAHTEGLAGHSDGDVLLHAITDALLGAVSAGDIGTFFPPSDPRWKGAASSVFLQTALEEIATAGFKIVNVDTVLVMAQPKIVPIAGELRESVARLLGVKPGEVGIKAKTPEGLGLDHVAMAHCTVLLESLPAPEALEHMAAVAEAGSEEELNAVVEGLVGSRRNLSALGRKVNPFDTDDLT
jgi:2-C-methyl-D-erythritol 2,4-cyclodiphosphate synthase